jgi:hypothetical protein
VKTLHATGAYNDQIRRVRRRLKLTQSAFAAQVGGGTQSRRLPVAVMQAVSVRYLALSQSV